MSGTVQVAIISQVNWNILGPAMLAVIAPILAYLAAARKFSGKIETTDADQLWAEAGAIRNDYKVRLHQADERILSLEGRTAKLEGVNTELANENRTLRQKVETLEWTVDNQRTTIEGHERTIAELRRQVNGGP